MFRVSPKDAQLNLFSSHHAMFSGKASKQYEAPLAWHNLFRGQVTMRIDETIFKPFYSSKHGCPNASIRTMIAMMILKEAEGMSDAKLFEQARFNILIRSALGLFNLTDDIPVESTYYLFRQRVANHAKETGIDLFKELFASITKQQCIEFNVSGKSIRMDSKLLSSNIAFLSRYELVHETLRLFYKKHKTSLLLDQELEDQLATLLKTEGSKVVYQYSSKEVKSKLAQLGLLIQKLLPYVENFEDQITKTLKQVFEEQFKIDHNKTVISRDGSEIPANSIQSPHDTDASYRNKNGQKVKGFTLNVTESCDDDDDDGEDQLNLISDIDLKTADTPDTTFVKSGTESSAEVFVDKTEDIHSDGAYHSSENQEYCKENNLHFYLHAIQGAKGRYDLSLITKDRLLVYDLEEECFMEATEIKSKNNEKKWRIKTEKGNRYFTQKEIDTCKIRQKIKDTPKEILQKRNNVEATIFQMAYHCSNGKTKYRGLERNQMWANMRGLWVNYVRILKFRMKNTPKPSFFAFFAQKFTFLDLLEQIWVSFFKVSQPKNFAIS